jgi:DNA-binding SARP family transcriptional activator
VDRAKTPLVSRESLREPDQQNLDRASVAAMVLEHSPTAVIVQDTEGRVVTANAAASRMLGTMVPLHRGAPLGCRVLGCRARGTRLADVCLHELARSRDEPLPPLRVELPIGSPVGVASVTLVVLEHGLTATELRGDGGQLAEWARSSTRMAEPRLRLFVLGRMRVMNGDEALEGRWTGNRAGHVLKLLVAERHRDVSSDEIITTLWPPDSSPDARGVRYFVRQLRNHLEPDGAADPPSSFIVATRSGYGLHRARVWVDADVFEQLVTEGCAMAGQDDDRARDLIRDGVAMYRGDFLADEPYAEWALPERDRLRDLVARGLRTLAEIELRQGELADATSALVRLGELEPFDVDVHRELFALLLRRGRRSETHRRYETLRRRMLATFDERLDFSLSQLT